MAINQVEATTSGHSASPNPPVGGPFTSTPASILAHSLVSLLVAAACFAVTIPLIGIELEATFMGTSYAEMSLDPLGGHGPHPERFLSPLLGSLVGLSGDRYWLFSHGMLVVFLALAHRLVLKKSNSHIWAIAFTLGLAVSGTVEVYRGLVGYSDPTTYCILSLCIFYLHRPRVLWLLLGLNLLNHGLTLFMWPWLLYERSRIARLTRSDVVMAVVAMAVYFFARSQLIEPKATPVFSASWYFTTINWAQAIELWVLTVPALVFCFGPLLIVMMWDLVGSRRRQSIIGFALFLGSMAAVMVLAIDIFRFVGLLAFPMLAAMYRRLQPSKRSLWTLVAAVGLMLAMLPLQRMLCDYLLQRHVEFTMQGLTYPMLAGVVPACWPAFVGYVVFVVLLFVVARHTAPQTDNETLTNDGPATTPS